MAHRIPFGISSILFSALLLPLFAFTPGSVAYGQHPFTLTIPDVIPASERSMVETPDGGVVLLFRKFVPQTGDNGTGEDSSFFGLAKFSSDGVPEWSRYVTIGEKSAAPVTLLPTSDGGFVALGNVSNGDIYEESDIVFLRFNAHGYLLSARTYDLNLVDDINDAIILKDGSLLIAGHSRKADLEEEDLPPYPMFTLRTTLDGDPLQTTTYPTFTDRWQSTGTFRSMSNGEIALLSTIYTSDMSLAAGLVCFINSDGIVNHSFALTPHNIEYYDECILSDIIPNQDGGYSLLGNAGEYGCGGSFSRGFAVSLNREEDTVWAKAYLNDKSITMDRFLPIAPDSYTVIGQITDHDYERYVDFEYLISSLNREGTIQNLTHISPLEPKALDADSDDELNILYTQPAQFLPASDGSLLIATSKMWTEYNDDDETSTDRRKALITRLSPDLAPCSGISEPIKTDGMSISFYTRTNKAEELVEEAEFQSEADIAEPVYESDYDYSYEANGQEEELISNNGDVIEREDMNYEEEHENEIEREEFPFVKKLDIPRATLDINPHTITDFRTIDFTLEPEIICQQNVAVGTSAVLNESAIGEASTALILSPNSIRVGESVAVDFTLAGKETPEITLLTVATGQTARQVESGAIHWTQSTGKGTARIETAGLAAGVYLVRVRSGEKQLTAKLEVR